MNKVLISTAKVIILFTVSTFFAYMILKAQIKGSMKQKQAEKTKVEPKTEVTEYILTNAEPNRNRNAVLTYVGSSKVDTTDIDLDVEGLDLVDEEEPKNYFETSKAVLTTVSIENVCTSIITHYVLQRSSLAWCALQRSLKFHLVVNPLVL